CGPWLPASWTWSSCSVRSTRWSLSSSIAWVASSSCSSSIPTEVSTRFDDEPDNTGTMSSNANTARTIQMIGPLKMFLAFTLLKVPGSSSIDHYVSFPFANGGRCSGVSAPTWKLSTIAVAAAVFSLWKHQTKDKPQDERRYAICPHHWMLQPKNNTRTTPSCRSQPKLNGFFPAT